MLRRKADRKMSRRKQFFSKNACALKRIRFSRKGVYGLIKKDAKLRSSIYHGVFHFSSPSVILLPDDKRAGE
ncbi:hypothetical protein CHH92_11185 [Bacillus sonorensis]|uniref:Uncharacterized protein n=1 Tax=Bacillus sonorensis L12 TaxID=1274524 RepID=M5P6U3_9BACI|nr:hypothetical protein BSONL12_09162 [Bacillus sonorensis L12]MBG9915969.1 hypothetical protein [Bacillus sonorensis]PAD59760.1 hypothetical protein CHH92_11185 [Bacillus sonorensis]RHJ11004.1 hypothetical protein DW143_09390 [Bacillus sonorensis]